MTDVVVIGCGVVGAAIAYELSKYTQLNIVVLEKQNDVATGATKANSAILHAGYDPEPGTLMAKLNVRGAELAEEICRKLDVPYKNNGALVLAFDEDDKKTVEKLYQRGLANGVKGLEIIGKARIKELDPGISDKAVQALYAPTSSIVSPWEYCLAMAETAVRNKVELKLNSEVAKIEKIENAWEVSTQNNKYKADYVINAAGCESAYIHDLALEHSFDIYPNRGEYYLLDKSEGTRVERTIFQCPSSKGKGILVSPTVHGNLIVGPNSEAIEDIDTVTTKAGLELVKEKAKHSVPSIDFAANIRNFAGVRAKSSSSDFIIEEKDGFIDVAGICSPGLSSAPAIAEYVCTLLETAGLKLEKKDNFVDSRRRVRLKELTPEEKNKLIKEDPNFGDVICRCETITRGEILAAFDSPIPPCSVDGVKRRVSSGMGRCQGGFCSPLIVEILSEKLGIKMEDVIKDHNGSAILYAKEEANV